MHKYVLKYTHLTDGLLNDAPDAIKAGAHAYAAIGDNRDALKALNVFAESESISLRRASADCDKGQARLRSFGEGLFPKRSSLGGGG
jgi:hypothetical protein